MRIEYIQGLNDDLFHRVGFNGITRIECGSYIPEPYCERLFYQVYKGEHLHATVNDQGIAEIVYFPPEQDHE